MDEAGKNFYFCGTYIPSRRRWTINIKREAPSGLEIVQDLCHFYVACTAKFHWLLRIGL